MYWLSIRLITLFILLKFNFLNSSHFYGGSLSSRPIDDQNKKVIMEFTIRFAYRRDYRDSLNNSVTYCNQTTINQRSLFGSNGAIQCRLNCINKNVPEILGYTTIYCVSFSEIDNWSYGLKVFNATINKDANYQLSHISNAWVKLAKYGYNSTTLTGAEGWEIRHKIDATIRSDSGKINSSPYTLMPPVITLPQNIQYTLPIPATDDDNDYIKCRWASWMKNECEDVCEAVPFAILNNCNLVLNLTNAAIGFYAVAIQIEDFKNPNDTYAFSSVPLQFLLSVVNASSCDTAPYIIGELPTDACIAENSALNIKVIGTVGCITENLTDISIIGPSGSVMSELLPLPQHDKTWYKTLSWNVTKAGQYLICSKALDTSLLVSRQSCYTIVVGTIVPTINQTTLFPTGPIVPSTSFIKFICNYTTDVLKPTATAYINLYSTSNNKLLYKINSAAVNTTKFVDNRQMSFDIPVGTLSIGNYYLTFDYGVALSTVNCKPISPKIDSSSFWTFQITTPSTTSIIPTSTLISTSASIKTSISSSSSSTSNFINSTITTTTQITTPKALSSSAISTSTTSNNSQIQTSSDQTSSTLTNSKITTNLETTTSTFANIQITNSNNLASESPSMSALNTDSSTISSSSTKLVFTDTSTNSPTQITFANPEISTGSKVTTSILTTSQITNSDYSTNVSSSTYASTSSSSMTISSLKSESLSSTRSDISFSTNFEATSSAAIILKDLILNEDIQSSNSMNNPSSSFVDATLTTPFYSSEIVSSTSESISSSASTLSTSLATSVTSIIDLTTHNALNATSITTNKTNSVKNSTTIGANGHNNIMLVDDAFMSGVSFEINFNLTNSSKISSNILQSKCSVSSLILMQFLMFSISMVLKSGIFGLVFVFTISKIKDVNDVK